MKFDKAKEAKEQKAKKSKSFNKNKDFLYSRLQSFSIYGKVSICLMSPEMKGHFKYLSELVNDGKSVMPWTIKITHINENWTVYVGCHSDIEECDISFIDILRGLEKNGIEISTMGTLHILSKIADKFAVEEIINILLKRIEDSKLDVLERHGINIKYTVQPTSAGLYTIPDNYLYDKEFDDQTYKKFITILDKLEKTLMNRQDKKLFHRIGFKLIRNKYINKNERDQLNTFMQRYIPENDRIKIAMNYLLNKAGK